MNLRPSPILAVVGKVGFFFLNIFAIYHLLRGHQLPGGGFIGGLVTASSLVLLSLALGWQATSGWLRVDPARVAFVGLLVAVGTAVAPMVFGRPLLEQFLWHFEVPLLGELHVGTPLAFDAGVFLVVVGIAAKMLSALGRATACLPAFGPGEEARYASVVEEAVEPAGEKGDDAG